MVILDIIRSLAIGAVLFSHIACAVGLTCRRFGWAGFYKVSVGGMGVTLFLVLSGLVPGLHYGSRILDYKRFMAQRALKIYPVYLAALFLSILIFFGRFYFGHAPSFSPAAGPLPDFFMVITGTYVFFGHWGGPIMQTSWFIGVIMALYMTFPFLWRSMIKKPHVTLALLFVISVTWRILIGRYGLLSPFISNRAIDWFPLCRIFEFGLGAYLAVIIPKRYFGAFNCRIRIGKISFFIARLSFPLFLIHYPLLFILTGLLRNGYNVFFSIGVYLAVSLALSNIILWADLRIRQGEKLSNLTRRE